MLVHLIDMTAQRRLAEADVARVVSSTLELMKAARRVGVVLLHDPEMAAMNRDHLGHEGTTDVITFTLDPEAEEGGEEEDAEVEIVVGWDVAVREGIRRGHGAAVEALFYVAHGVLHGLGLDDRRPAERAHMHRLQRRALEGAGFALRG